MKRLGQFYCLDENEYKALTEKDCTKALEEENARLLDLLFKVLPKEGKTGDKELSRKDFVEVYNFMVKHMDTVEDNFTKENNAIYVHDCTVHWHGLYCNCSDGATVANNIIPAITSVDDEEAEFE